MNRMSNIINVYEGKQVDKIIWPFYRYDALIPKQIKTDLFVWLYLSLYIFKNNENKKDTNNYDQETKNDVIKLIKDKFSSVIDEPTIEKVVSNAEKEFIVDIKDENNSTKKILNDNTFSFVDTYEELFSQNLQIQHVYQDALTGDVIPYFGETLSLQDARDISDAIVIRTKKQPNKKAIQNAYKIFNKLGKINSDSNNEISVEEDFFDPDEETDFDADEKEETFVKSPKSKMNPNNFNVVFLDNSKVLFNLEIPIYIEDNELTVETPFGPETHYWLNKRFKQAISVCPDLDEKVKLLKQDFISSESTIEEVINKKTVSEQLIKCGNLYRLAETTNNYDLKKFILKIDNYFDSQNESYFYQIGKYLECLVDPLSTTNQRRGYDYSNFCREIESRCTSINVDYKRLENKDVFDHWKKGWSYFKADIANLILNNSKLINSKFVYYDFLNDLFSLYDMRNNNSHYKKDYKLIFNEEQLEKLFLVSRVLVDLY